MEFSVGCYLLDSGIIFGGDANSLVTGINKQLIIC